MDRRFYPLLSGIEDMVDKAIDRAFSGALPKRWRRWEEELIPPCDLIDKGDHLLLRAEVPGLNKEDLEISVDETSISLRGEIKQAKEEKGETYYRSERTYGSFSRVIDLPTEINTNQVDAGLRDGVLEVKLPKKKTTKAKRVEIKVK